jgi:hypothetical protein
MRSISRSTASLLAMAWCLAAAVIAPLLAGGCLGSGQTILVTFQFQSGTSTVSESGTVHLVNLTIFLRGFGNAVPYANGTTIPFSVTVSDAHTGTAVSGVNYQAFAPLLITFPKGSQTGDAATVTLNILNDNLLNGNKTVVLQLSAPSGLAGLSSPSTHTVTIVESSTPPPPTALWSAPLPDALLAAGGALVLSGTVSDPVDPPAALTAAWSSNVNGALSGTPAGPDAFGRVSLTMSAGSLTPGEHLITLTAQNTSALTGSAVRHVIVDRPPTVAITSPANGSSYLSGSLVAFGATAGDPDAAFGDTVSVAWTSSIDGLLSGTSSFTTASLSAGTHVVTVTATDSRAATASGTVSVVVISGFVISGTCIYEQLTPTTSGLKDFGVTKPIRRAEMELFLAAPPNTVLATTHTDENGLYSFTRPVSEISTGMRVRVMPRRSAAAADNMSVQVVNASDVLYAVTSGTLTGPSTADLRATSSAATGRLGGAFSILDTFLQCADMVRSVDPSATFPTLVYIWQVDVTNQSYYIKENVPGYGMVAAVHFTGMTASDSDEYDNTVIGHETAHFFEEAFSSIASPGGTHSPSWTTDPGLALSEGMATFISQAVAGDPNYIDTWGPNSAGTFNIAPPNVLAQSIAGENAVSGALWELFDSGTLDADGDPFNFGFGPFWTVFSTDIVNGQFKSLHTYLDSYVARLYTTDPALNAAFGTGGTQPLGIPRPPAPPSPPFPLTTFTEAVNGVVSGSVVNAALGYSLNLGIRRRDAMEFYGLDVTSASRGVTITLTNLNPGTSELDFFIETTERNSVTQVTNTGVTDSLTFTFPRGRYHIIVWARNGAGAANFTLSVTFN